MKNLFRPMLLTLVLANSFVALAGGIPRFSKNDKSWMRNLIASINGGLLEAAAKNGSELEKFKVFSNYIPYYLQEWALPKIAEKIAAVLESDDENTRSQAQTQLDYLVNQMKRHFSLRWKDELSDEANLNRYGVYLVRDSQGYLQRDPQDNSLRLKWSPSQLQPLTNEIKKALEDEFEANNKIFEDFRQDSIASLRKIQRYL